MGSLSLQCGGAAAFASFACVVCVCVRGWLSLASREESQGGLAGGLRAGVEGKQLSILVQAQGQPGIVRAFLQPLPRKLCELWPKAALHPGLREQRYPGEGELHVCSTRVRLSSCLDVRRFNFASSRYSPTGCSSEKNPCENDPHIYIIRIDYVAEASSMLSREVHTHCSICMCCAHPYVPRLQPYDEYMYRLAVSPFSWRWQSIVPGHAMPTRNIYTVAGSKIPSLHTGFSSPFTANRRR